MSAHENNYADTPYGTPVQPLCVQQAAACLDEAWQWLCQTRSNAPDNADIWHLRFHWHRTREPLLHQLLAGDYRLTSMILTGRHRDALALWSAQDALVLKWVALLITPQLTLPARCEHVKGHEGGASSVARMSQALQTEAYSWVCRTDVKGYYASMNKEKLLACVYRQVAHPVLRDLLLQYVRYCVEDGGEFYTPEKGIARGCALSPLMGALYLADMDEHFSGQKDIYYARYMDDVVILANTRWQLRRQVRVLNQFFNAGEVIQHPDKTFIGRTERGFDWMGAQMSDAGVAGIAHRARVNHAERLRRLYERVRRWPAARRQARMSQYRAKWKIWAGSLTACVSFACAVPGATASVGNAQQLLDGVKACLSNPAVVINERIAAGTTCTIQLTGSGAATTWSQSLTGIYKHERVDWSGYLQMDTGSSFTNARLTLQSGTVSGDSNSNPLSIIGTYTSGTTTSIGQMDNQTGLSELQLALSQWPTNPTDVRASVSGSSATHPGGLGGTLVLTFKTINPGEPVILPRMNLGFGDIRIGTATYFAFGFGVGGSGGLNPNPPSPPVLSAPPVCAWGTPPSATQTDFGTVVNQPLADSSVLKSLSPVSITASCTSNGASTAVQVSVDGYTTSTIDGSGDVVKFQSAAKTENGLLLSLQVPGTPPAGITYATGGRNGALFLFGTQGAPKPWWFWAVAARTGTGTTTLPALQITPQLRTRSSAVWTKDIYDKDLTATVVLRMTTK